MRRNAFGSWWHAEAALVAAFALALRGRDGCPLGVPGEWEWQRLKGSARRPSRSSWWPWRAWALYCGVRGPMGFRSVVAGARRPATRRGSWLAGLVVASVAGPGGRPGRGVRRVTGSRSGSSPSTPRARAGISPSPRSRWATPGNSCADYPGWIERTGRPPRRDPSSGPLPGLEGRSWGLMEVAPRRRAMGGRPRADLGLGCDPGVSKDDREDAPGRRRRAGTLTGALTLLACASDGRAPLPPGPRSSLPASGRLGVGRVLAAGPFRLDVPADGGHGLPACSRPPPWRSRAGPVGMPRRVRASWLCATSGLLLAIGHGLHARLPARRPGGRPDPADESRANLDESGLGGWP